MNKSPNFTKGTRPKIGFVIHGTLGKYEGAIDWLCTPPEKRPVLSYSSAHYVIAKDGRVTQLVDNADVSWHAGTISNPTRRAQSLLPMDKGRYLNPNESFIGIELEWLSPTDIVTENQYQTLIKVIKDSGIKNPIILCHKEIAEHKADFPNSKEIVDNITVRLSQGATVPQNSIVELLSKLNSQVQSKDFKGAKDTTSYLFNELSKINYA